MNFLTYKRLSVLSALSDGVWRFSFSRHWTCLHEMGWLVDYICSLIVEPFCLFLGTSFGLHVVGLADSLDVGPTIAEGRRRVLFFVPRPYVVLLLSLRNESR